MLTREARMATNVKRDEWSKLTPVPPENWCWKTKDGWQPNTLGPCDVDVEHGRAHAFFQTSDHRAIALCLRCDAERELSTGNTQRANA